MNEKAHDDASLRSRRPFHGSRPIEQLAA